MLFQIVVILNTIVNTVWGWNNSFEYYCLVAYNKHSNLLLRNDDGQRNRCAQRFWDGSFAIGKITFTGESQHGIGQPNKKMSHAEIVETAEMIEADICLWRIGEIPILHKPYAFANGCPCGAEKVCLSVSPDKQTSVLSEPSVFSSEAGVK